MASGAGRSSSGYGVTEVDLMRVLPSSLTVNAGALVGSEKDAWPVLLIACESCGEVSGESAAESDMFEECELNAAAFFGEIVSGVASAKVGIL